MVDYVILSCDTNPKFFDFWPLVSAAWRKLFKVRVFLGLVHEGTIPYKGEGIISLPAVKDVPLQNQAKVGRYWLAAMLNNGATVLVNDIDLLPLTTGLVKYLLEGREAGHLATLGSELYVGPEKGKFMAGHLTQEARGWKKLVNPTNLDWEPWIKSFVGLKVFDEKEDISSPIHGENPNCFSDESLLRYLLRKNPVPVVHKKMPFWPYTEGALDRANWKFDQMGLSLGRYAEAHLPRPLSEHRDKIQPLIDYIEKL